MDKERKQEILGNLEEYDKCRLECDGLSRVLSYILTINNVTLTVLRNSSNGSETVEVTTTLTPRR